jgi:GDPmannose 4,6-dehydratase
VKEMVEEDIKLFSKDKYLRDGGHEVINYNEE